MAKRRILRGNNTTLADLSPTEGDESVVTLPITDYVKQSLRTGHPKISAQDAIRAKNFVDENHK